ncbi:ectonucleoside triphosphate diphosphohydrolase 8-like isoform X2 [Mizuhopecten yessoensis]|uniref:Ectonucleoside triphosphate diphosphohydrolase 8 n=2 Tax=Mizuhopecten yessoensis TaxID=6573 RepID=A0A210PXG5_MIZYE|nr:ectonucleoside triphosphate diphosphohydrolase 8-like isoform X2 [Mizuhopecten yessoensis]XP_021372686.1 ectonucleoside triphosphate diphosphohydrolase 8-like isoform X2 [Mizuhopecten yessoensis]XP_021372687.1 ectonucleoside triphosphate diphosphohydrolase 8-like isoform X2 [Mizuhopecten yessoensis]XP_021372688.1 ectonucleoside triphosphate diphosphohydrolase 8-like isoform X2 [Mizuhopecten yessoensis]XP_021372689.1 ectonucleoside triphosphate diphosphohydrolase 8-like isoform X2 [Mizuhopect
MGTYLLLGLSMILIPNSLASHTTSAWNYGVMFDAGSSSSKLKIYKWPTRLSTADAFDMDLMYTQRFKPGISDYVYHPDDIPGYLGKILNKAKSIVPVTLHHSTPLFMMATAGLRVLPESDAIALMTSARQYLGNASVNPFTYSPHTVRILSGEEEGAYGWIAANYLRNFFGSNKPPSQAVGVLEMGGGSTQITFVPDGPILANMFPVRMAGVTYYLYAHSYLYYGQTYMAYRIRRYLEEESPLDTELYNPCMLRGDNVSYSSDDGTTVILRGDSNPTKCLEILNSFLQSAEENSCYPKPCAIGQIYQPSLGTDTFFAISAYVYAPTTLRALDPFGRLKIKAMNTSAHQYCRMTLAQAINATGTAAEYASGYCMMGLYIPSLLTSSYGFPSSTNRIQVADKINGESVDWALGAVLYELEQIDYYNWLETCGEVSGGQRPVVSLVVWVLLGMVTFYIRNLTNVL